MPNKNLPEGKFNRGFYFWFDEEKRRMYYATPLYLYKTVRKPYAENNRDIIYTVNYEIKKEESLFKKAGSDKIIKNSSMIKTPYVEPLGLFLLNFINANFSSSWEAYKTFFYAYGFSLLKDKNGQEFDKNFESENEFMEEWTEYFEGHRKRLLALQDEYRTMIDIIFNLHGKETLEKYKPLDKLYALLCVFNDKKELNEEKYEIHPTFIYRTMPRKRILEDVIFYMSEGYLGYSAEIYISDYIEAVLFAILKKLIQTQPYPIKVCEHCSRYFIPESKINEKYCTLPNDDGIACKDKASRIAYADAIKADEVKLARRRAYQRQITAISREKDKQKRDLMRKEFDEWKDESSKRVEKYEDGLIDSDDLVEWLRVSFLKKD